MIATLKGIVDAANDGMPTWGVLGVGLAAVISWLGVVASGLILAIANGRINASADKAKDDLQRASSIAVENVRGELGQAAETHKLGLRKKEWLFDKELEAVRAFVAQTSDWMPMANFPDYDTSDAARDMVPRLGEINAALRIYSTKYAAVLPSSIRSAINECSYHIAEADLQIEYAQAADNNLQEPTSNATGVAERVISELAAIEGSMLALIRS